MNPPYGRELGAWMAKAYRECRDNGALVVAFVPARVDTEWWHQYAAKATEVRFPKGRVKFAGAVNAAPFPVAVVVFRPRVSSPNTPLCVQTAPAHRQDRSEGPGRSD
jgi:site-specific DNA-methyltransferase (adenine-specific)